jgi:hypothetical protein
MARWGQCGAPVCLGTSRVAPESSSQPYIEFKSASSRGREKDSDDRRIGQRVDAGALKLVPRYRGRWAWYRRGRDTQMSHDAQAHVSECVSVFPIHDIGQFLSGV